MHKVNGDYKQQGCQYLGNLEGNNFQTILNPLAF